MQADGPTGFGVVLRRYRSAAGLSQEALAERAGLSRRGIADLERGARTFPYGETVRRLADALGLDPAERAALLAAGHRQQPRAPGVGAPLPAEPSAVVGGKRGIREAQIAGPARAPHNLPAHPIRLIGRDEALALVRRRLLEAERGLLTLTGAGGCGKTVLAQAVARDLIDAFPDGDWLVEFAPLSDPGLVPQAVASVLGVQEGPERPLLDGLIAYLESRVLLLVLDNCEHLVDACARLAERLLDRCPELRILATSREPLGVVGEQTWRVPSLAVPDPARLPPLEDLGAVPAVRLFVERARRVEPVFALSEHNGGAIAEVCARLGGLPLALELAAARVNVVSAEALATRLEAGSLALLGGGGRGLPSRQRTLRATLDWTYGLLAEPERVLLRRLAVFAGGFDLEAAEAVGALDGAEQAVVLDVLARLLDWSLVVTDERFAGDRYRLLEPVRQYAQEKLAASGEAVAVGRRHATHYLALAERAEPELEGPNQAAWYAHLDREHDNLRATLRFAAGQGDAQTQLRLGGALGLFWLIRGYPREGLGWLEDGLAREDALSAALRAKALSSAGTLAFGLGEEERAEEWGEACRALCRELGDARGEVWAMLVLYNAAAYRGDFAAADATLARCLALSRAIGDATHEAMHVGDMGRYARWRGDRATARRLLEEALVLTRRVGNQFSLVVILAELALLAEDEDDDERAAGPTREALGLLRTLGTRWYLPECLELAACAATVKRQYLRAAHLFGAAEAVRDATGMPPQPGDRTRIVGRAAAGRAALAEAAFPAAWAEGRRLSLERAIEEAISGGVALAEKARNPTQASGPCADLAVAGLTEREREVAVLVARGLSNKQIGNELLISRGTAGVHVGHILAKLGLDNRAQLATWVTSRGQQGV
jgi:non-specific serine/threonine protein kinase